MFPDPNNKGRDCICDKKLNISTCDDESQTDECDKSNCSCKWYDLNIFEYTFLSLLHRCDFDDINYCNLYYKTQLIVAGMLGLHGVTALLEILP